MIKLSAWDWLAYVALGILIAYFLLKILRIIHSPIELDILALISGAYLIGRYILKVNLISNELKQIKKNCKYCN